MSVKRLPVMFVLSLSVMLLLSACQKAETPSSTAQATAAAPPPPAPPPETSQGKLVRVEFAPKTKMQVTYLTTGGLRSEVREEEAGKGKVYVVLSFEGKPAPKKSSDMVALSSGSGGRLEAKGDSGERELWLTDSAGKKYGEPSGHWEKKESGRISFEVPEGLTGLVFHDGNAAEFPIKPLAAAEPPQAAATLAKK